MLLESVDGYIQVLDMVHQVRTVGVVRGPIARQPQNIKHVFTTKHYVSPGLDLDRYWLLIPALNLNQLFSKPSTGL